MGVLIVRVVQAKASAISPTAGASPVSASMTTCCSRHRPRACCSSGSGRTILPAPWRRRSTITTTPTVRPRTITTTPTHRPRTIASTTIRQKTRPSCGRWQRTCRRGTRRAPGRCRQQWGIPRYVDTPLPACNRRFVMIACRASMPILAVVMWQQCIGLSARNTLSSCAAIDCTFKGCLQCRVQVEVASLPRRGSGRGLHRIGSFNSLAGAGDHAGCPTCGSSEHLGQLLQTGTPIPRGHSGHEGRGRGTGGGRGTGEGGGTVEGVVRQRAPRMFSLEDTAVESASDAESSASTPRRHTPESADSENADANTGDSMGGSPPSWSASGYLPRTLRADDHTLAFRRVRGCPDVLLCTELRRTHVPSRGG